MNNWNQLHRITVAAFLLLAFQANLMACQAEADSRETTNPKNEVTVEASVVPETVEPGETATLVISVSVPTDFHIYGSRDKTHSTTVKLSGNTSFSAQEAEVPQGRRHRKNGAATNFWLTGTNEIRQQITVANSVSGMIEIAGEIDFMMCDKNFCKPPAKVPFQTQLMVKAPVEDNSPSETNSPPKAQTNWSFEPPVRLEADGKPILIEFPGYASPTWGDITGDGLADLVVGQFSGGKIQIFPSTKDGKFGAGQWLKVDGKVGHVPDIW